MKVAITGAAGHLGRAVLRRLLAREGALEVVALDRVPVTTSDPRVKPVLCDVRDPELAFRLEGCDALVHLAFVVERGARDQDAAFASNLDGSINVFNAAARAGVGHVVYTSSISAYGFLPEHEGRVLDEDTPIRGNREFYYAHSKAEVERYLDVFEADHPELAVCRLRPSAFLGTESSRGIAAALRARVFVRFLGAADPLVHLTHEEDVALAVLAALERKAKGAFNLAAPEPLRLSAWGEAMGKRSLNLPGFTPRLLALAHHLGLQETPPGWFTTAASHSIVVDSSRARRELGWEPVFPTTAIALRAVSGRPTALASRGARLFLGGAALSTRLRGDIGGAPGGDAPLSGRCSLNVLLGGPRPSEWHAQLEGGRIRFHAGLDPDAEGAFSLSDRTFVALLAGGVDPAAAQARGELTFTGEEEHAPFLDAFVRRYEALREARGLRGLPRRAFARLVVSGARP